MGRVLTWAGAAGAGLGLVCCFTPLLPIAFGAVGAGGLLVYVYSDAVLLPFVALSIAVLLLGLRMGRP